MLTNWLLSLALAAAPLTASEPGPEAAEAGPEAAEAGEGALEVQWEAPSGHIAGRPFLVKVTITSAEEGAVVAGWMLTAGAFTIDGKALTERAQSEPMPLPGGFTISGTIDLAPFITSAGEFKLAYASELLGDEPFVVSVYQAAPAGIDYMAIPVEELDDYNVLLVTTRGNIVCGFWPEAAPNHVRNFLALSAEGFYDGTIFHRVIPNFMIQGGDPTGTGSGGGPRQLKAEFSTDPRFSHKPGVLSMARSPGNNDSASCQFFIMHEVGAQQIKALDGQYSAFGQLVSGAEVVDAIVNTPSKADRPNQPQTIEVAVVVKAQAPQAPQAPSGQ
jgi:peptidyl-prolyl cis-trans isomerase B (cyclophilin B)